MHTIGIDIGSSGVKGVMLNGSDILATYRTESLTSGSQAATDVMNRLLSKAGKKREDVFVGVTGIGGDKISFADVKKSALLSLSAGARYYCSSARTILDVGAETTTAINLSPEGKVLEYVRNSKCAAGTSMLLKVMSEILQIPIDQMDGDRYRSERKIRLSNICSVFAESEAVSYLGHGTPAEDILSGVHEVVVDQLVSLLSRIDVIRDVVASGGASRNKVIIENLSHRIEAPVTVPPDPEMTAALGVALLTREKGGGR